MKTSTGFSVAVLAAAILLLLPIAPSALAQDQVQYQDQAQDNGQDPPTRAGRIGFVQGSVSFQPGGEGDWLEAVPNRPLTTGDNLWVDKDSRAEIQIGSTSIRLGPETSLTFLDLGDNSTQLRLSMGTVFFRVRHFGSDDSFEVDAPNLAFNVNQPGEFRLDVNENGDQTVATVWHGEAEITGGGDSYSLGTGQQGTFSGVDRLNYDVDKIGSPDDFSVWAMSRDAREDQLQSRDYVSDEMTGYEDLDDYGRWHEVAGYGNVWSPAGVPGDWAPYRYGHWVFISPWGWTWVEQEPWGFAPFHYGRWAFVGSSWCWVPGPVAVRPVYSPALVAFVGGGGFHLAVGVGVGWFPLGPGEVFVPWYHTSPRYVQRVNVTNTRVNVVQVTNVYNNHVTNITYVNQRVNNSVTVVNHDTFVNARSVHNNILRVDARAMASAPVTHEVVNNIRPAQQSVLGGGRRVQMRPPEQAINRPVVGTRQPVVVTRPAAGQGAGRVNPAPPVKMIRIAPPTEAKPLQSGQRGSSAGSSANPPATGGPHPGAPDNNRGGFAQPGNAPPQSGMRGSNPPQGQPVPRPGNPNNGREANPQPPNTQPPANPQPVTAEPNRPAAPENGRGMKPDNDHPPQQVPHPPAAVRTPEQAPPPPDRENVRPNPPNAPTSNIRIQNPRPQEVPHPTPEAPPPPKMQNQEQMQEQEKDQPAPPQPRQQTAPVARPEPPPQPPPQPEVRQTPLPRTESRPTAPPPPREPAHVQPRTEKPQPPPKEEKHPDPKEEKENKPPQKFR
jgi:hypothetical protein